MSQTAAPSSDNLLLGKGQVLFSRTDPVTGSLGFKHLGNVETFELTTADTSIEKYSSMTAGAPLYKKANQKRTVTLKVTGEEFTPENVALALMGDQATLVQPATAVVAEALAASTQPGTYLKLAKFGPYTGVTVSFGGTGGVLGTDWEWTHVKAGVIHILPGTILTGAVTASYTPTAYTSTTGPQVVGGGTSSIIQGAVLFIGDPSTGPAMMAEVWKVDVTPDSAIGLISQDWASLGFMMAVLEDSKNHAAHPLYQVTYL